MQVQDFMTKKVITAHCDMLVKEAAKLMVDHNISVLPIVNVDTELVGILTESDFVGREVEIPHALASIKQLFGQNFYFGDVESVYSSAKEATLQQVMTKRVHTIESTATLDELVRLMISKELKRVPVISQGKLIGIVTRKNLINAFLS